MYRSCRARCSTRCGVGMGLLGLTQLLGESGLLTRHAKAADAANPLAPKKPHFPAKAKRVIHIFANGGPSQVDTFDPKPALDKYAGKPLPTDEPAHRAEDRGRVPVAVQVQEARPVRARSQRTLRQHREAHRRHLRHPLDARGRAEPRAVVPADELRRAAADPARASGSWVTYGLGTENQNLPGFVAMCPGRVSAPGVAELAVRVPARASSRAPTSIRKNTDVEKLVEFVKNKTAPSRRSGSNSTCSRSSTRCTRPTGRTTRNSKPASSRSSWPTGCRRRRPTRSTSRSEPQARPRRLRPRRAGAEPAPRAAAGRARGAVRAGSRTARCSRGTATTTWR